MHLFFRYVPKIANLRDVDAGGAITKWWSFTCKGHGRQLHKAGGEWHVDRVTLTARSFFIAVLQKAACLKAVKIPPKAWYVIFSTWKSPMTIFSLHQLCTSLGTWWPGLVSVSTILTPGWFLMQSLKGCFVWEKKLVNQSWTASDSLTWWDQPLASSFGLQLPKADAISTSCVKAKNIWWWPKKCSWTDILL